MRHKYLNSYNILITLFIINVILLAVVKIHDTDAWQHLSLGKLLWELKTFPDKEMFAFPSFEMPFSYSSWLFGIICYLVHLLFKAKGLVFFKTTVITFTFWLLFRDSIRPHKNIPFATLVLALTASVLQFRYVLRPDIFLMCFLTSIIFCLNKYLYEKKYNYLYLLPIIHFLWANSHSSINLMFVPFAAFLLGSLIQQFFKRFGFNAPCLSKNEYGTILMFFLLSFVASLISPYFLDQYFHGSQYLTSDWYKDEILELAVPKGWWKSFIITIDIFLAASFIFAKKRMSFIHLILVLPFLILPFVSQRFIILMIIIGIPIFIRNVSGIVQNITFEKLHLTKPLGTALIGILIITNCTISFAKLPPYNHFNNEKQFGLGFEFSRVPQNALKYMDKNKINGRIFNPLSFGSYIIWESYPNRTVFIDARGYIPFDLFKYYDSSNSSYAIEKLSKDYKFDVILERHGNYSQETENIRKLTDTSFNNPNWALVYWDDISRLYLKRGNKYNRIIERDEYVFVKPDRSIEIFIKNFNKEQNKEKIINELTRNIAESNTSLAYMFLGIASNISGQYAKALEYASRIQPVWNYNFTTVASNINGIAYKMLGDYQKSLESFKKIPNTDKNALYYLNIGHVYLLAEEYTEAIKWLSKAQQMDKELADVYPLLEMAYNRLGNYKKAKIISSYYKKLQFQKSAQKHFEKGIQAYNAGDLVTAIKEYKNSIAINPNAPIVHVNLGFAYLDTEQFDNALNAMNKALRLDNTNSNAHYGLAQIYRAKGNYQKAILYFIKYQKLEPKGYFARLAAEQIEELSQLNNHVNGKD